ncbi:acyl-CoA dehydrogenase family protein, partial [Escherichia coli]
MNFDFSDEQKQMRDEARKFLSEQCPPKAVREVLDGKAPYDKSLWKGLAEMGFLG